MKIITNSNLEEIIGKKIVFIHVARFADNITIATDDGSILVITQDIDYDDYEEKRTRILNESQVINYIDEQDYIRKELERLDLFDVEKYKKRKQKREQEYINKMKEIVEEREKAEYVRLKAKFEKEK